jgi:hypothetical protein
MFTALITKKNLAKSIYPNKLFELFEEGERREFCANKFRKKRWVARQGTSRKYAEFESSLLG